MTNSKHTLMDNIITLTSQIYLILTVAKRCPDGFYINFDDNSLTSLLSPYLTLTDKKGLYARIDQ